MSHTNLFTTTIAAAALSVTLQLSAHAQMAGNSTPAPSSAMDIQVTITNEGNSDFTLTPLWFGFQDGTFDLFDPNAAPSPGLELIAEDGDFSTLINEFTAAAQPGNRQGVTFAPGGFGGAPVIEPGESGTSFITPINPANYQYFSFASMVIPSNDTFIGNASPTQYQVFTPSGDINDPSGTFTIQIFGSDLWDAGTELNNGLGSPFSTLGSTGSATDTNDGIGPAGDLSEFLNDVTPSGITVTDFIAPGELLATITISQVPEPSTVALSLLALGSVVVPRRRTLRVG